MTPTRKPTRKNTRRSNAGQDNGKASGGKDRAADQRILSKAASSSLAKLNRSIAASDSYRLKLETLVADVILDIQQTITAHPTHFSKGNHFSVTFAYQEATSVLLEELLVAGKQSGEFPGIPLDTTMRSIYNLIFTKADGHTTHSEQKLRGAVKRELKKLL
jgi:hypothetical protein